jgi:hypothetical protein
MHFSRFPLQYAPLEASSESVTFEPANDDFAYIEMCDGFGIFRDKTKADLKNAEETGPARPGFSRAPLIHREPVA